MPNLLIDNAGDQTRNRHPVDQLAEVRHQIADLKKQEDELRRQIIDGECSTSGEEFIAEVVDRAQKRLDTDAIRREFGMAMLRPFMRLRKFKSVLLVAR